MVRIKKEVQESNLPNVFQARANVNFSIPVNMYPDVRKYNQDYLERLKDINGDGMRLPLSMGYKPVFRGDILQFGDELVMDEDTGNIKVYPKEIYEELSSYKVELPCIMRGSVHESYETINALATPRMRKAIEELKEDTSRFRVKPYLEKYTGTEPDLED